MSLNSSQCYVPCPISVCAYAPIISMFLAFCSHLAICCSEHWLSIAFVNTFLWIVIAAVSFGNNALTTVQQATAGYQWSQLFLKRANTSKTWNTCKACTAAIELVQGPPFFNNNNNNNNTSTIFMVQSWQPKPFWELVRFICWMQTQHQIDGNPQTWAMSMPVVCCYPHLPSPFVIITQPES